MSTLKGLSLRLAALTALRDYIDEEVTALRQTVRDDALQARQEYGVKSLDVQLPDGSVVATVTLSDPQPRPFVFNEQALLAYVRVNYPQEVVESVRDSFKKVLLEQLAPMPDGDGAVNTATGEVVDGVTFRTGSPSIALRYKQDGRYRIECAWREGGIELQAILPPAQLEAGAQ